MSQVQASRLCGIQNDLLRWLHDYWQDLLKGREMPSRTDIDPVDIPPTLLPHLLLTEVTDHARLRYRLVGTAYRNTLGVEITGRYDARLRYRLVGTAYRNTLGVEITGRYVDEIFRNAYGHYLIELGQEVVRRRRPIYTELVLPPVGDGTERFIQRLSLPLSTDGTNVDMLFSGDIVEPVALGSPDTPSAGRERFTETLRLIL